MKNEQYVDLGTAEIHQRHSVMIEGGAVPRAKVMDQTVIDRLLMEGQITINQYQAAEYLLEQAHLGGMFLRSPRMDGLPSGGGHRDTYQHGLMKFGRTVKLVARVLGQDYAKLTMDVVVENREAKDLAKLGQALDLIADRRLCGGRNPLRHLD